MNYNYVSYWNLLLKRRKSFIGLRNFYMYRVEVINCTIPKQFEVLTSGDMYTWFPFCKEIYTGTCGKYFDIEEDVFNFV